MKHPITLYYLIINVFKEFPCDFEKNKRLSRDQEEWPWCCLLKWPKKARNKKTENERKKAKNREGQLFVCLRQSLFKINKSVCHWYVLFDRNTVHLGHERKYLKLKHKGPAWTVFYLGNEERKQTHNQFTGQMTSCGLFHYSVSQTGTLFPLLKCW